MSLTEIVGASGVALLCGALFVAAGDAQPIAPEARLAALDAELASLEREIGLLEDTKAIKRLQRAYGYYVDKKLSREIGALFADDPATTAELGGSGVYVGRARIAEYYDRIIGGEGLKSGQLFNHMILQGVVHVAPDGLTAKGRWRALIQIGEHGQSATWAEGPYENEYVKEDGVWKFSKVHWYQTFSAPYSPGWHKAPEPMNPPLADFPPDRPPSVVYQSYPGVFQPPYHYANPVSGRCEPGVCEAVYQITFGTTNGAHGNQDTDALAAALRTRLASVEERAARIDDINAIQNLQGSYGYYTDKMLRGGHRSLRRRRHARDRSERRLCRQGQHSPLPLLLERRPRRAARRRAQRSLPTTTDRDRRTRRSIGTRALAAVPDDRSVRFRLRRQVGRRRVRERVRQRGRHLEDSKAALVRDVRRAVRRRLERHRQGCRG
jgi:hypothetical protein